MYYLHLLLGDLTVPVHVKSSEESQENFLRGAIYIKSISVRGLCINNIYIWATFKGLCHQTRKAWKWYSFRGLDMDMRFFLNCPLIFNRHFKFLCGGTKRVQIFYLFQT
jgi:hypothetical protein